MLYAKGTKVRLRHTGDLGEVVEMLGNDMVSVYVYDDDMDIPISVEDVIPIVEDIYGKKAKIQAQKVPLIIPKKPVEPERKPAEVQYQVLKSLGIQLAFEPIKNWDDAVTSYKIWMINDTNFDTLCSVSYHYKNKSAKEWHSKLVGCSFEQLGEMRYDQLNDAPIFDIKIWRIKSTGTDNAQAKTVKIKPKQFFSKVRTAPFLNVQVHWYRVFERVDIVEKINHPEEDLRNYTKRNIPIKKEEEPDYSSYEVYNVKEFAEFVNEIDLHIHALIDDAEGMDAMQIVRIQLSHFEGFMNKAIRLGVERVFIIHGLGKGRLRDMIAQKLKRMPEVYEFKNEYHPRYGWGATEVIF